MKKNFNTRLCNDLFPEMPQSFMDGLQNAIKKADVKPRKHVLRKILIGASAAVLAAACALIVIFGVFVRNRKHTAAVPPASEESTLVGIWTLTRVETITESGTFYDSEFVKWGDITDQIDYESWLEFTADGYVTLTTYFPDMGEALHNSGAYTVSGDTVIAEWRVPLVTGEEKDVSLSMRYDAESDTICTDSGLRREYYARTPDAVIPEGERREITALRSQYPAYFGLDTSKGLKVYVWQMSNDSYSCALLAGSDNKTDVEIGGMKGTTIEEMRLILSTYDIEDNDIDVEVVPFRNPLSSYWYEIDKAYTDNLIWLLIQVSENDIVDKEVCDVDGDGRLETCELSYGPTSGLFTVEFTVYRNGAIVYHNTFNMEYGYLQFVCSDGKPWISHTVPQNDGMQLAKEYAITIEDGVIVLTDEETGETVEYWGNADTTWNMKTPTGSGTVEKLFGGAWYSYDKGLASYTGYDELLLIEFDPDGTHVSFTEDRRHYEGYSWQTDADDPNALILTNETTGDVRRATLETQAELHFETAPNALGERSEWTYYSLPVLSAENLPFGESANIWWANYFVSAPSDAGAAWCNSPLGMFDLDGDGKLELIRLVWEETSRKMTVEALTVHIRDANRGETLPGDFGTNEGELYYTVEDVAEPVNLILIDLDPADGRVNLLVSAVTADGAFTYELHVEDGKLVCGHTVSGSCFLADSLEREVTLVAWNDSLNEYGYREVRGEALEPVDDRLYADGVIDAILFGPGREKNIEYGILLHLVRALPCEIDGVPGALQPEEYIYLCDWNESMTEIGFATEDGRGITIHPDAGLTLDGIPLAAYFDNAPQT